MSKKSLYKQNIIACIWDFDKTLIPDYMQTPLFEKHNIDEQLFWKEVNMLPDIYAKKGIKVSSDAIYLNHLLSHIKDGNLKGLTNSKLRELGSSLVFYSGLPDLFSYLEKITSENEEYIKNNIRLEHYIISTGLAEMIRGSKIAPYVKDIFGCEFVEAPMAPGFTKQEKLKPNPSCEINQIGNIVDNTIKTRYIFEINKGGNIDPSINVNASIEKKNRRIPLDQMIYIADGPSDIPCFSVIKENGGKAFAVFNPKNDAEFEQNDALLNAGRIDAYGPADYSKDSITAKWLIMHVKKLCDKIVEIHKNTLNESITPPPKHLHLSENT